MRRRSSISVKNEKVARNGNGHLLLLLHKLLLLLMLLLLLWHREIHVHDDLVVEDDAVDEIQHLLVAEDAEQLAAVKRLRDDLVDADENNVRVRIRAGLGLLLVVARPVSTSIRFIILTVVVIVVAGHVVVFFFTVRRRVHRSRI